MKLRYLAPALMAYTVLGCNNEPKITTKPETVVTVKTSADKRKKSSDNSSTTTATIQSESDSFPQPTYADGIAGQDILLTGRIVFENNKPLPDTEIIFLSDPSDRLTLSPSPYAKIRSNSKGYYKIGLAKDRIYQIATNSEKVSSWKIVFESKDAVPDTEVNPFAYKYNLNITVTPTRPLFGSVTDDKGTSIPHARIWIDKQDLLSPNDTVSTSTDRLGNFLLTNYPEGNSDLHVFADGYRPAVIKDISDTTTSPIKITMIPGGGVIKGKVTLQSGAPVSSGTQVQLLPGMKRNSEQATMIYMKAFTTATDEFGNYRFSGLPINDFTVKLSQENKEYKNLPMICAPLKQVNTVEGSEVTYDFQAYTGHTIRGIVFDKESSTPLAGIKVTTYPFSSDTVSNKNGYYKLDNISEFTSIKIDSEKYLTFQQNNYPILTKCDQTLVNLDIPVVEPVYISGSITNTNGFSVPNASIDVRKQQRRLLRTQANSKGLFKIAVPPLETVSLSARAAGYTEGGTPEIDPGIQDINDINIVLSSGFTVTGTVTDKNKNPILNAKVYSSETPKNSTFVSNGGEFRIGNMGTKYVLMVEAENYKTHSLSFRNAQIKENETTSVQVILEPSASISGAIQSPGGVPVTFDSHRYVISKSTKDGSQFTSINAGKFKIPNLSTETTYALTIQGNSITTPVIAMSGSKNVVLTFEDPRKKSDNTSSKTLTVKVIDEITKQPVTDADVSLDGTPLTPDKFQKGVFTIGSVPITSDSTVYVNSKNYFPGSKNIGTESQKNEIQLTVELSVGGALTGKIIDASSGNPIQNALIRTKENNTSSQDYTIPDAEGKFILSKLKTGSIKLSVKPEKPFIEYIQSYAVPNDDIADIGEIRLTKGGTIQGKVLSRDKQPQDGIQVVLGGYNENYTINKSSETDTNGEFKFENLPPLNYQIRLAKNNFTQNVELQAEEIKNIIIEQGGTNFHGKIQNNSKVLSYSIRAVGNANNRTYYTNNNAGEFSLKDMFPGKYVFYIRTNTLQNIFQEQVEIPDQPEVNHTFQIPSGSILGLITDSRGKPIENVIVSANRKKETDGGYDQSIYTGPPTVKTNKNGVFTFDNLPTGYYNILASSDIGSAAKNGVIVGQDETKVNITLQTNGGNLESLCINAETGSPIMEAWCSLMSENGTLFQHSATRDEHGVLTVKHIPPGKYTVGVTHWSFTSVDKYLEIKSGETTKLEAALYPAGAIRWTLRTADGSPASNIHVRIEPQNGNPIEKTRVVLTSSDGLCVERGLTAGTYKATALKDGKSVSEMFIVAAKEIAAKETVVKEWK